MKGVKMNTETDIKLVLDARKSLLTYFGILVASCLALQIVIAIRGSKIDIVAAILLGIIAIYYTYNEFTSRKISGQIRYGRLVTHLVGYLVINLSFHIHAFFLFINDSPVIQGEEGLAFDGGWFGILIPMTTFWGLGLLTHAAGSIISRGFEEVC